MRKDPKSATKSPKIVPEVYSSSKLNASAQMPPIATKPPAKSP